MNENQQRVLDYIDSYYDKLNFIFRPDNMAYYVRQKYVDEWELLTTKFVKGTDTLNLIIIASRLAKFCDSYNPETGVVETSLGCYRSSLDLWRHVKSINPDVTIFEVMYLLRTNIHLFYGQFCHTVERRVFKIFNNYADREVTQVMDFYTRCEWDSDSDNYRYDNRDEYGLLWDEWLTINA